MTDLSVVLIPFDDTNVHSGELILDGFLSYQTLSDVEQRLEQEWTSINTLGKIYFYNGQAPDDMELDDDTSLRDLTGDDPHVVTLFFHTAMCGGAGEALVKVWLTPRYDDDYKRKDDGIRISQVTPFYYMIDPDWTLVRLSQYCKST